jgi:hypothetical protein
VKTKSHTQYRLQDGTQVIGVTTALGILNKPALLPWVAKITKEGHDWTRYRDDKASIGTLAHAFSLDYFMGTKTDTSHYDSHQISQAENSALSFFKWCEGKDIVPILIEGQLVSEAFRFGGTIDFFGLIDGVFTLLDLKSGGIWPEHIYQCSAYSWLLEENGFDVKKVRILGIPRTEDEGFIEKSITDIEISVGWEIFQRCLDIYNLKKQIKK